jgi:hypothetical protein
MSSNVPVNWKPVNYLKRKEKKRKESTAKRRSVINGALTLTGAERSPKATVVPCEGKTPSPQADHVKPFCMPHLKWLKQLSAANNSIKRYMILCPPKSSLTF